MGRRVALLIATYQYHDAGLRQLTAPAHDAESFAAVLRDPDIAGFEVTTLINEPHHRVGEAIGDFYDRVVDEIPQQRPKKQDNAEGRTIIARNINWSLPAYLRNAISSPIATDRLGALDGLDHLYRIGKDVVRACVRDEIQRLTDDDSRIVSSAAVERLRSILPQPPDVPEPQAQKAPEFPTARTTTPPARQAGFFVPAVVSARPPDPTLPTAEPPYSQPLNCSHHPAPHRTGAFTGKARIRTHGCTSNG